jgi:hypothetical protein
MAERGGPHGMITQRVLEVDRDGTSPGAPKGPTAPPPNAGVAAPEPSVSREPSNRELMERQRKWLEERDRFESAPPETGPADEVSK